MKNILRAFAPLMAITAAYDGLYEGNLSPKVVDTPQSEESIAAYKKAAEEKRKRRAEKRKEKSNEKSNEFNR